MRCFNQEFPAAIFHGLQGVHDDIEQNLLQQVAIQSDSGQRMIKLFQDNDRTTGGLEVQEVENEIDGEVEIHVTDGCVETAKVQQSFGQVGKTLRF